MAKIISCFTTRELAIGCIGIVLSMFVLLKDKDKSIWISMKKLVSIAVGPKIIIPFGIMVLYLLLSLFVWEKSCIWDYISFKDVIFWIIAVGIPFLYKSVTDNKANFIETIKQQFSFSIIVSFLISNICFSFMIELAIQIVSLFIFAFGMINSRDNSEWTTNKISIICGCFLFFSLLYKGVKNYKEFISIDFLVAFFIPFYLLIISFPYYYLFSLFANYETLFVKIDSIGKRKNLKIRDEKIKAIKICKISIQRIRAYVRIYTTFPNCTKEEIVGLAKGKDTFDDIMNKRFPE